jgi:type II secretion system-associated lipoprotein
MKIIITKLTVVLFLAAVSGCATMIDQVHRPKVDEFEKKTYTLLNEEAVVGQPFIKGTKVKLVIISGGDWVKVYAYNSNEDVLNAKRSLILYLFKDDFPTQKFELKVLEKKLFEKVK